MTTTGETFADRVIAFNRGLHYEGALPEGIHVMNPFRERESAVACSEAFYRKYYSDAGRRRLILGINPGRLGAGLTGIPFTDPKRLVEVCGIPYEGKAEHEPSSVFVYEVVAAYGGPEAFYRDVYIHSACPLGFTTASTKGQQVNLNYYDVPALARAVTPFILDNIRAQIALGVHTDRCLCFGTGKNFKFLQALNAEHRFFGEVVPLEHPRFIMQYRSRFRADYVRSYLDALRG
jgi:hypothetical protein